MSTEPGAGRRAPATIRTPCVQVCVVDAESGLCLGCRRTIEEIADWSGFSAIEREAILAELPARRSLIAPEKPGPT